jgi:hypothetical protein
MISTYHKKVKGIKRNGGKGKFIRKKNRAVKEMLKRIG